MKITGKLICAMLLLVQMWMAGTALAADDKEAQRAEIRKSSQSILNQLYKIQPSARKVIDASVGYAVFSNFGMKIFLPAVVRATAWLSTKPRSRKPS